MYSADDHRRPTVHDRYHADRLDTASNASIVTMCFDRLDSDLAGAMSALDRNDLFTTNEQLGHAQDLLGELATMVDPDAWEHAGSLLAVYDYLLRILAEANIRKEAGKVEEAQRLVAEIGDAFRAARTVAAEPVPTRPAASGTTESAVAESDDEPRSRFSVRA